MPVATSCHSNSRVSHTSLKETDSGAVVRKKEGKKEKAGQKNEGIYCGGGGGERRGVINPDAH